MMTYTIRRCSSALIFLLLVSACGLLDVSDPTTLEDADLDSGTGADLLRKDALAALSEAIGESALVSGMLTDEFLYDPRPGESLSALEALDRRESADAEAAGSDAYEPLQGVRLAVIAALPRLRAYAPDAARAAYLGQMLAVRGYGTLRLAEDFCPGFALTDIVDGKVVLGSPLTTTQVFERALADFDSAAVYAADTTRFRHLAQVGRARALLGLGRLAEAAAAAALVPTEYVWHAEFSANLIFSRNPLVFTWSSSSFSTRRSVADGEGGTGLDYVAANDPRVVTTLLGPAHDGVTEIRAIAKYPDRSAPIVLASGIEARLIEAEAALQSGGDWLGILNALRTTCTDPASCPDPAPAGDGGVADLSPLADPGTETGRVDLLFRERAFWLFATGHRLADLQRLIRHYGRSPESVFPSGLYRIGGSYGSATNVPFPAAQESVSNPAVTGCTSA